MSTPASDPDPGQDDPRPRPGLVVQVAAPPTIVFDMVRDGNRDIYRAALDGADLVLYTPATGAVELILGTDTPEVEPAWSPDGQWIAFTSARNGRTDIYRVRVTGGGIGEVEQLTDRAETDARPAWLADGRIVYVARVGGATRLRWLDPEEPGVVYEIPVGDGEIGKVVGVW